MERVLNLPLRGTDYRAVTAGELRRIQLPTSERTHRLLFGKDDKPKPYTRVNIRLGVGSKPTQYELVRYERTDGEYFVTLGEPISEVDEETWVATIEAALVDWAIEYLGGVKGYCVAYEASEYKRLGRSSDDIVRTYAKVCQYSEAGRMAGLARRELSIALWKEVVSIWRGLHHAVKTLAGDTDPYTHMKAEALTGLSLCRYFVTFHKERGGKLGTHYREIAGGISPLFAQYAAPYDVPPKAEGLIRTALEGGLSRFRKKSQIIKS